MLSRKICSSTKAPKSFFFIFLFYKKRKKKGGLVSQGSEPLIPFQLRLSEIRGFNPC